MIHRALSAVLLLLSLAPGTTSPQVFQDPFEEPGKQIFFAVLEGLYRDGVSNEVVDKILETDGDTSYPVHFVWCCPVCMPAYEAFCVYRARTKFHDKAARDTFGPGLPADQVERLTAVDLGVSQRAVEELIQVWMERRMDALRLTDRERAEWKSEMEKRRKQGMSYLDRYQKEGLGGSYAAMKTCPICEGANGACKAK